MSIDADALSSALRLPLSEGDIEMSALSSDDTSLAPPKPESRRELEGDLGATLARAHDVLMAQDEQSLLVVLQGLDAAGKGGTIRHVFGAINPAGLRVAAFKEPTDEEQRHEFLWRYRRQIPEPGEVVVFDRSHYEDVIVPLALGTADAAEIDDRVAAVNEFEHDLVQSGTTVLKCFLHLSYDEQRERFLRRLRRPDKRWKFSAADLETRRSWSEFQAAHAVVLPRTSTEHAPWYIIPADRKWYRNWAVGQLVASTLDTMKLSYPEPGLDLEKLRAALAPPH